MMGGAVGDGVEAMILWVQDKFQDIIKTKEIEIKY